MSKVDEEAPVIVSLHCGTCQKPYDNKQHRPLFLPLCKHSVCDCCYSAVEESCKETGRKRDCPECHTRVDNRFPVPGHKTIPKSLEYRDRANEKFADRLTEKLDEEKRKTGKTEPSFAHECQTSIGKLCDQLARQKTLCGDATNLVHQLKMVLSAYETKEVAPHRFREFVNLEIRRVTDTMESTLLEFQKLVDKLQLGKTKLYGGLEVPLQKKVRAIENEQITEKETKTTENCPENVLLQGLPFECRPFVADLFSRWRLAINAGGNPITEVTDEVTGAFTGQYIISFVEEQTARQVVNELNGLRIPDTNITLRVKQCMEEPPKPVYPIKEDFEHPRKTSKTKEQSRSGNNNMTPAPPPYSQNGYGTPMPIGVITPFGFPIPVVALGPPAPNPRFVPGPPLQGPNHRGVASNGTMEAPPAAVRHNVTASPRPNGGSGSPVPQPRTPVFNSRAAPQDRIASPNPSAIGQRYNRSPSQAPTRSASPASPLQEKPMPKTRMNSKFSQSSSSLYSISSSIGGSDDRFIIVTHLPISATYQQLKDLFSDAGSIVVNSNGSVKVSVLPDATSAGSARVCYIEYEEAESADIAIERWNSKVFPYAEPEWSLPMCVKRYTKVPKSKKEKSVAPPIAPKPAMSQKPPVRETSRTVKIFVQKLPTSASRDYLGVYQHFVQAGRIAEDSIGKPQIDLVHNDGVFTGCCKIEYKEPQSVLNAIESLDGRPYPQTASLLKVTALVEDVNGKEDQANGGDAQRPMINDATIIVQNVPKFALLSIIQQHFGNAGVIAQHENKKPKIDQLSPGCFKIEYTTPNSANEAIRDLNDKPYPGTAGPMRVQSAFVFYGINGQQASGSAASPLNSFDNRKIVVKNLPKTATKESIAQYFGTTLHPIAKHQTGDPNSTKSGSRQLSEHVTEPAIHTFLRDCVQMNNIVIDREVSKSTENCPENVLLQGLPFECRPFVADLFSRWRLAINAGGNPITEVTDEVTGAFTGQYIISFVEEQTARQVVNELNGLRIPDTNITLHVKQCMEEPPKPVYPIKEDFEHPRKSSKTKEQSRSGNNNMTPAPPPYSQNGYGAPMPIGVITPFGFPIPVVALGLPVPNPRFVPGPPLQGPNHRGVAPSGMKQSPPTAVRDNVTATPHPNSGSGSPVPHPRTPVPNSRAAPQDRIASPDPSAIGQRYNRSPSQAATRGVSPASPLQEKPMPKTRMNSKFSQSSSSLYSISSSIGGSDDRYIIVTHLPISATYPQLKDLFSGAGSIVLNSNGSVKVSVLPDATSAGSARVCYIEYEEAESADIAIERWNNKVFPYAEPEWSLPMCVRRYTKVQKSKKEKNVAPPIAPKPALSQKPPVRGTSGTVKIFVQKLPTSASRDYLGVYQHFVQAGRIAEDSIGKPQIYLVHDDGVFTGCCKIEYREPQSVVNAIESLDGRPYPQTASLLKVTALVEDVNGGEDGANRGDAQRPMINDATIIVQNVPKFALLSIIQQHFGNAAQHENKKPKIDQLSPGCFKIEYTTPNSAREAIRDLNDKPYPGTAGPMRVLSAFVFYGINRQQASGSAAPPANFFDNRKIVVKNLPTTATKESIAQYFGTTLHPIAKHQTGDPKIRMVYENTVFSGKCVIEYDNEESALIMAQMMSRNQRFPNSDHVMAVERYTPFSLPNSAVAT